jgi:hypothetical protein
MKGIEMSNPSPKEDPEPDLSERDGLSDAEAAQHEQERQEETGQESPA